jgi:hypothetical protein
MGYLWTSSSLSEAEFIRPSSEPCSSSRGWARVRWWDGSAIYWPRAGKSIPIRGFIQGTVAARERPFAEAGRDGVGRRRRSRPEGAVENQS